MAEVKYKSIFISDVHLGTRGCQAKLLNDFLKKNTCENLYLVGDIIDGWRLKNKWYMPASHANVIRRILGKAKHGTRVYYIIGNHDEYLRKFLRFDISFGKVRILNKTDYHAINGKRYLVIHGDLFDKLMNKNFKWLMFFGDKLYAWLIMLNLNLNRIRSLFGLKQWSLSKFLKSKTKEALNFILKFEELISNYCREKQYDGVICGHIHTPAIKKINGADYMNCGDWVESCSALVEEKDGTFKIINYG
jgi:UDP-2,3-diacylglucosamine pyrophosphatase LpxH